MKNHKTFDNNRHSCKYKSSSDGYGAAIYYCIEDEDGKFWVGNDEYESQVNYCPFCGATAPTQSMLEIEEA